MPPGSKEFQGSVSLSVKSNPGAMEEVVVKSRIAMMERSVMVLHLEGGAYMKAREAELFRPLVSFPSFRSLPNHSRFPQDPSARLFSKCTLFMASGPPRNLLVAFVCLGWQDAGVTASRLKVVVFLVSDWLSP